MIEAPYRSPVFNEKRVFLMPRDLETKKVLVGTIFEKTWEECSSEGQLLLWAYTVQDREGAEMRKS